MREQKSTDGVAEFRILHYLCNSNQDNGAKAAPEKYLKRFFF